MPEKLRVHIENHIEVITLNNPPVNILCPQIFRELDEEFMRISADDQVRVVILTGAGERAFSGGGDRKIAAVVTPQTLEDGFTHGRVVYDHIRECSVPVIAAVNGPAVGGGLALVASCDIIIAAERAIFFLPEVGVGMWPQYRYLARLVPELKMRMMIFTGQRLSAQEMYRFGSIERVVKDEELMPTAMQIAQNIAEKNSSIVRLLKKAANDAENMSVKESRQVEYEYIHRLVELHDAAKIRKSFLDKGN